MIRREFRPFSATETPSVILLAKCRPFGLCEVSLSRSLPCASLLSCNPHHCCECFRIALLLFEFGKPSDFGMRLRPFPLSGKQSFPVFRIETAAILLRLLATFFCPHNLQITLAPRLGSGSIRIRILPILLPISMEACRIGFATSPENRITAYLTTRNVSSGMFGVRAEFLEGFPDAAFCADFAIEERQRGRVGGRLLHVGSSSEGIDHAAGCFQHRCGYLQVSSIIPSRLLLCLLFPLSCYL